jgi:hypothetical protein
VSLFAIAIQIIVEVVVGQQVDFTRSYFAI